MSCNENMYSLSCIFLLAALDQAYAHNIVARCWSLSFWSHKKETINTHLFTSRCNRVNLINENDSG